jgi:hypothetical protein
VTIRSRSVLALVAACLIAFGLVSTPAVARISAPHGHSSKAGGPHGSLADANGNCVADILDH